MTQKEVLQTRTAEIAALRPLDAEAKSSDNFVVERSSFETPSSLGTLYFALTGALPFPEREPAAVLAAHLSVEPHRCTTWQANPSPPLSSAPCSAAWAKDPAERPASTRALLDELDSGAGVPI